MLRILEIACIAHVFVFVIYTVLQFVGYAFSGEVNYMETSPVFLIPGFAAAILIAVIMRRIRLRKFDRLSLHYLVWLVVISSLFAGYHFMLHCPAAGRFEPFNEYCSFDSQKL